MLGQLLTGFKQFITDLRTPTMALRHNMAKEAAFVALGLIVGMASGFGMYFFGYTLANAALGALGAAFVTGFIPLMRFTTARAELAAWADDIIDPPVSVTLSSEVDKDKLAKRKQLIKEVLDSKNAEPTAENVAKLKKTLKEIFSLRSHSDMSTTDFKKLTDQFDAKYDALLKSIKSPEDWHKPDTLKQLQSLVVESAIYSDALLAQIEQELREVKKPVSTQNVAKALVERTRNKNDSRFLYSGIVDLYQLARSRLATGGKGSPKFPEKEDVSKFYEGSTTEGMLRKVYNTFVKHGFYQNYGNKAFRKEFLKPYSQFGDQRFDNWTQVDSKKTKAFGFRAKI